MCKEIVKKYEAPPKRRNCFIFQVLSNGNLAFPPFRAEDYRQEVHAQVYVCLAKNAVGSIHSRDVNVRAGRFTAYHAFIHS